MISVFADNEEKYKTHFLLWLQRALFEFESRKDLRETALDHIRVALNIAPNSFQVIHAYCKMHLDMAVAAKGPEDALLLMQEASDALEQQMADPVTEPYALTVLAVGRVRVFKKWFPSEVRKEAIEMQQRLLDAQRRYPNDAELAAAIREVSLAPVNTVERAPAS